MSASVSRALLTAERISLIEHEQLVDHESAGATVGFVGNVRDHDGGKTVLRLEYSAHPSAQQVLTDVVERIAAEAEDVRAVAVSHRIGALTVGEAAFVVAVSADHRRQAFVTCQRLVDEVKAALPVWKHQFFADGSNEWVGSA
ncbi:MULTISPECIES: molybdenum cofactor biosynthesis protein MoaE [unclassified Mycobacterium]|uniref:molybdenum cofactor biosynthesis protein MoaE n=1 Tax=unclassified Mycobacterium TaxID=2642494 RepID=UPI000993F143|nr:MULTISPECIES: molybdenum cofactor biosynthesis protein MoaE [unclassified Mycobacterium]